MLMTPSELYQAGQLTAAINAGLADVKKHPTDTARRGLLCELLCFAGAWERADKQLDTIGQQEPLAIPRISLFRQLIRAELARQQFFAEGRLPEFLGEPTPVLRLHLQASIALRENKPAEAAALLTQAEEQRLPPRGECDGQAFEDFRDLDDFSASFFEVLTSTGKYYWIPIEAVEVAEFRPPERPHDLLWRRTHMVVTDGPDGEVFLPTIYPLTFASGDDQLRLGRGTDWRGQEGEPVRGVGLRMFLVGDQEKTILELKDFRGPSAL
jgi:type VI secretion system protein ImpE